MLRRAWRSAALGACSAGVEAAHMCYSGQHSVALLIRQLLSMGISIRVVSR